jgi:hypothetical protein
VTGSGSGAAGYVREVPHLPPDPTPAALRRGLLAVSVVWDLDLDPADDGVRLPGPPQVLVGWAECVAALQGADPETPAGHTRLHRWLRARRRAADLGPAALHDALRPLGLPVGHVLHPGPGWVAERVLGGALDLGPGVLGLDPAAPDTVVPLPLSAVQAADQVWAELRTGLERLGAVAAGLLAQDAGGVLRPAGDADVVTLLGARTLRTALAAPHGGMAGVVVPMRRRGWTRLRLVDPAFAPAAAAATEASDRGFARALLVTADEVSQVADPDRAVHDVLALRQPAAASSPYGREVRRLV